MTTDNPYAALEALEARARTSPRKGYEAKHKVDAQRTLVVKQDAAVREPNYRGGAVFEFEYVYQGRYLTRVQAQDLLDGYEPEPEAPFSSAEFASRVAAPKGVAAVPMKYETPAPVTVSINDSSHQAQVEARQQALERLALIGVGPAWWDVRARFVGGAWVCSFERRVRRRE